MTRALFTTVHYARPKGSLFIGSMEVENTSEIPQCDQRPAKRKYADIGVFSGAHFKRHRGGLQIAASSARHPGGKRDPTKIFEMRTKDSQWRDFYYAGESVLRYPVLI